MVDAAASARRETLISNGALAIMVVLWGSSFPVIDALLRTWDVLSATAGRQIVAATMLLGLIAIRERRFPLRASLPWRKLFVLGTFGLALSSVLMTTAISTGRVVATAMMSATSPIVAALTARLVFGMPLYGGIVAGTLLALVGGLVIVVMGNGGLGDGAVVEFRGGAGLVILATVSWTWYSQAAQRWLAGYSQLHITGLTVMTGAVAVVAIATAADISGLYETRFELTPETLAMVIYLGVVPIGIGAWLWMSAVSRLGVTVASIYHNFVPISAVLVAMAAFGVMPTVYHLIGGVIILAGVVYSQIRRRAEKRSA
jgi:drug/metabolite transporter (DMT)-like permease